MDRAANRRIPVKVFSPCRGEWRRPIGPPQYLRNPIEASGKMAHRPMLFAQKLLAPGQTSLLFCRKGNRKS